MYFALTQHICTEIHSHKNTPLSLVKNRGIRSRKDKEFPNRIVISNKVRVGDKIGKIHFEETKFMWANMNQLAKQTRVTLKVEGLSTRVSKRSK
jgi:hypothetical protein